MLHARPDYQRIQDPENRIGEFEPVFLLRAQDNRMVRMLALYAEMAAEDNDAEMAQVVALHILRVKEWQMNHDTKPGDLPQGTKYTKVNSDLLRRIVFENLNHANKNGYFDVGQQLHGASAEEIAGDMIAYAEDCGDMQPRDLVPHINEWINEAPNISATASMVPPYVAVAEDNQSAALQSPGSSSTGGSTEDR